MAGRWTGGGGTSDLTRGERYLHWLPTLASCKVFKLTAGSARRRNHCSFPISTRFPTWRIYGKATRKHRGFATVQCGQMPAKRGQRTHCFSLLCPSSFRCCANSNYHQEVTRQWPQKRGTEKLRSTPSWLFV